MWFYRVSFITSFEEKNFRVIVIDNLSIGKKLLFKGDRFYKVDISKKKSVRKSI